MTAPAATIALTNEDRRVINNFLFDQEFHFTQQEWEHSYPQWSKGSQRIWGKLHQGGTGILRALMWYHHRHKPGSKEHRAAVIIEALKKAAWDRECPPVYCHRCGVECEYDEERCAQCWFNN